MADETIDTLRLEVESDASNASDGIERLTKSLLGLSSATRNGQTGLANYAKQIKSFADSAAKLKDIKFPNIANLIPDGNGAGLTSLAQGMSALAQSTRELASVKLGDVSKSVTRLERLGGANISGLVSALQPLNGLDLSNLNNLGNAMNGFISSLAGAEKVGAGTSKIFSALAQLASSAGNITVVQQALPGLSAVIRAFIGEMANAPVADAGTVSLVTALSGIASSGTKAQKAANALPEITVAVKEFINALANAPALNDNIVRAVQALSQLSNAGGRAGTAARSLNKNIKSLSSSMLNLRKSSLKAFSGMKSFARQMLSAVGAVGGLYAAVRGIKASLDISSDLTEVQNVVDVTFGDMADKIERLTDTSIVDFGLSELTAKKISSRFQAMGVAMGFSQEKMSDMSIELTKLAADMASFYNVAQEDVAQDLESIFTGTTRPLRQYGIDLTQATLQEWALSQGMNADIKSMTQAEKTLLRYNYVLAHTGAAQGDFARTSGTWANQLRILVQSFQALGAIIGEVLINAFKPFITALNSVMQKVIQFARTVANALGAIFGWKIEINTGGITNDIGDIAAGTGDIEDNAGGTADNLGDAAKNAKKLKDYVLGIDELNILSPDEDTEDAGGAGTGGAGGGAGGLGGFADAANAELVKTQGLFDKYKSDIDSLYELGKYISDVLSDAMESINWDAIYAKARNFGKGLADFLNGLINPRLFGNIGKTIANSLNTVLHALDAFGERFDWTNLGKSIAAGINAFFKNFDFKLLAHTINIWAKGILTTMLTALRNVEWREIGERIGQFLVDIDFGEIAKKFVQVIWEAIKGALDVWNGMFDVAPIETAIITAFGAIKLAGIAQPIIKELSSIVRAFTLASSAIAGNQDATILLAASYPKLAQTLSTVTSAFSTFQSSMAAGNGIITSVGAGIDVIRNNMSLMAKGIIGAAAAFLEFNFVKDNIEQLILGTDNLIGSIAQIGVAVAGAGVAFTAVFEFPAGIIATAITAVIGAIVGIGSALNEIEAESAMASVGNALRNPGGTPLEEITDSYKSMVEGIGESFDIINQKAAELETTRQHAEDTASSIDLIKFAIENGSNTANEKLPELKTLFDGLLTDSKSIFDQEYDVILTGISGSLNQALIDAGISVDGIVGTLDRLKTSHQKSIDDITAKNAELEESYASGEISNEEYTIKLLENYEELAKLTGKTDELSGAIDKVSEATGNVDFSQFVNADNTLNLTALRDQFEQVGDTASEAKESIYTSSDSFTAALQDMEDEAKRVGDTEAIVKIGEIFTVQGEEIDNAVTSVDDAVKQYGDAVQIGVLERIPSVIDEAIANYSEQSWLYKLVHTETDHVQSALDEYQANVIDPTIEELSNMYSDMGVEGETWASDAAKTMIDGLFDTTVEYFSEGQSSVSTSLREDYKNVFDTAFDGLANLIMPSVESVGKDVNAGLAAGIKENPDEVKSSITSICENLISWAREALDSHSPSRKFKEIGNDTVQGMIDGLKEKWSTLETWFSGTVSAWIDSLKSMFNAEKWKELFAGIPESFKTKWGELTEWFSVNSSAWLQTVKEMFSAESWSEVFSNILLAFQTKWAELTEWWNGTAMVAWWEESVAPWFTVEKWSELLLGAYTAFETKFTEIFAFVDTIWNKLSTSTTTWWTTISNFLTTTFLNLKTKVETTWTGFYDFITKKWTDTQTKTKELWTSMFDFLTKLFENLKVSTEENWTHYFEFISQRWEDISLNTKDIWESISSFIRSIYEDITQKTEFTWSNIKEFINEKISNTKDILFEIIDQIKSFWFEAFDSFLSKVQSIFSSVYDTISDTISAALELVSGLASAISNILSAIGSIGGAISGAISSITSINFPGINIPGFAEGGMPRMGDLFLANEAGPEFIGSIGGRSAVVNNDQIVASVATGVRSAVAEVMVPYLNELINSTHEIAAKDMSVNIGDRDIAMANMRGQSSMGIRLRTV